MDAAETSVEGEEVGEKRYRISNASSVSSGRKPNWALHLHDKEDESSRGIRDYLAYATSAFRWIRKRPLTWVVGSVGVGFALGLMNKKN